MRRCVLMMLLLGLAACAAAPTKTERASGQMAALQAELKLAWDSAEFASIRAKTAFNGQEITTGMQLDDAAPTLDERQAFVRWDDRLALYTPRMRQAFRDALPSPLDLVLWPSVSQLWDESDRESTELVKGLYQQQYTWGRFNTLRKDLHLRAKRQMDALVAQVGMAATLAAGQRPTTITPATPAIFAPAAPTPPAPVTCTSTRFGVVVTTTCQ